LADPNKVEIVILPWPGAEDQREGHYEWDAYIDRVWVAGGTGGDGLLGVLSAAHDGFSDYWRESGS